MNEEIAAVLRLCSKELRAWMKDHGQDIRSQEAVKRADAILAAGASEGQADTYDVRVAFEEIARAISEHEPPDRRVAVSMRALNRWHQALAKFLYATPPGAAAEIADLREQLKSMQLAVDTMTGLINQKDARNSALRERIAGSTAQVDDLRMLVQRLVHSLNKASPDNDLGAKALDYLVRKGLTGSILRDVQSAEQDRIDAERSSQIAKELRKLERYPTSFNQTERSVVLKLAADQLDKGASK